MVVGAAVDVDGLAGDEPPLSLTRKTGGGDLVRFALTAQRDAGRIRRMPRYHPGLSRLVLMLPGETTFTRMFCAANSEANARASPTRPIFAAETWARPLPPVKAPSPVKNRMRHSCA